MAEGTDDLPRFRIHEKRVDSSWKEEVRKERELAKQKELEAAAQKNAAAQKVAAEFKKEVTSPASKAPVSKAEDTADAEAEMDALLEQDRQDELAELRAARKAPPGLPAEAEKSAAPVETKSASAPVGSAGGAQKPSKIFIGFLAQMIQQALMQLGMVESPFTGQREFDPEGAKFTIELLKVLQEKTKGNLADQEAKVLNDSVRDLEIQFVKIAEELNRQMNAQMLQQGGMPGMPGMGGGMPGRPGRGPR